MDQRIRAERRDDHYHFQFELIQLMSYASSPRYADTPLAAASNDDLNPKIPEHSPYFDIYFPPWKPCQKFKLVIYFLFQNLIVLSSVSACDFHRTKLIGFGFLCFVFRSKCPETIFLVLERTILWEKWGIVWTGTGRHFLAMKLEDQGGPGGLRRAPSLG